MSRGFGAVQRRLLEHLLTEDAGAYEQTGEPVWESVPTLAGMVYGNAGPSDAQCASVRRALRRLAQAQLVDVTRARVQRTYRQRRRHRSRYLTACAGPACLLCDYVRRRTPIRIGGTLVEQQLREISGDDAALEIERLHRYGWHEWLGNPWNDFSTEVFDVHVSTTLARRHLTNDELAEFRERMRRGSSIGSRTGRPLELSPLLLSVLQHARGRQR